MDGISGYGAVAMHIYKMAHVLTGQTQLIRKHDADGDGVLSADELGAWQGVLVAEAYTNSNEQLYKEELQAFIRRIYA